LTFVPQNSQDFGFTGHLYVLKDSTYAVKRCLMNLPKKSGVNFVENLDIIQNYEQLSNGQWVLTDDDMIVDLALFKSMQGIQVERTTKYTNHSFDPIEARLFKLKGDVIKETDMLTKTDEFWATYRQVPLTKTESSMDLFVNQLQQIPGFKFIIFGAKALIENFVETGTKDNPSKFDFGPINTMVSSNYIDGTRLRLSGQTTGNLDPHWFLSGYAAYGFKDQKWKYKGELLYAFNKRKYLPWEYPKNNLSFSYSYDVMSPMDKFLATDKDNVFVAWKTTTVDQMSYVRDATLTYDLETAGGFSIKLMGRNRNDEPTGKLEYLLNDATLTDDQASITELQNSPKDRAENLMIVDLLRNDIGRVSKPGTVRVPKLFAIESFKAVHHLVSTVTSSLAEQYSAVELLTACFPGGSITGAPKVRAMEIIEELEPHRRSAYCGSMFYISRHGRMDSSITIRTLIAWQQQLYVWAGGGIVADSDANAEYQETFDKLAKILPILEQSYHEPN
jgi:hypothetical protein